MPSQASSPPLAAAVLAALWLSSGRCGASGFLGPACDDGKLYLARDLPAAAAYGGCPIPPRPQSTQRLPSIDTVYDPEPARQICMDHPISYNQTIPNSGAFRPVMAESGEYLYCPPQRWLHNLHQGATVLLYHPCTGLHERSLLSGLARSCLPDHIITPHPQLSGDMPIALVSWGRTLELTAVASSDVCDWLQMTQNSRKQVDGRIQTKKYNLLLTRSADLQHLGPSPEMKDSMRQCCEQTISSLLRGSSGAEPSMKNDYLKQDIGGRKKREIQAVIGEKRYSSKRAALSNNSSKIDRSIPQRTVDTLNHSSLLGATSDSLPGQRNLLDPSFPRQSPLSEIQQRHQAFTSTPTSESLLQINSSQHEGTDSVIERQRERNTDKSRIVQGKMTENEVVDVEEREAEHNQKHSPKPLPHKSENKTFNPASKSQPERQHQKSQSENNRQSGSNECSDCPKSSGGGRDGPAVNVGLLRTPRTDEAVWAAAALGFLLVLLTLSILHTRLYRHWRTTPSLYWHDPQQDYDSVADVIRRRLRIAKRRRKRSRRKECVLLPSSSSSDENL